MRKPIAIYIEGAPCSLVIHPTYELAKSTGSLEHKEIASFIVRHLSNAFSTMRKGEPQWAMARLIGHFNHNCYGITTISVIPPPTKADYDNNFVSMGKKYAGLLVYNCGSGTAKFMYGELAEAFAEIDVVLGRMFPHDFPEEEQNFREKLYNGDYDYEDEWE